MVSLLRGMQKGHIAPNLTRRCMPLNDPLPKDSRGNPRDDVAGRGRGQWHRALRLGSPPRLWRWTPAHGPGWRSLGEEASGGKDGKPHRPFPLAEGEEGRALWRRRQSSGGGARVAVTAPSSWGGRRPRRGEQDEEGWGGEDEEGRERPLGFSPRERVGRLRVRGRETSRILRLAAGVDSPRERVGSGQARPRERRGEEEC
jgi:hypothetical protein